jgi:hypothetical protein
MAIASAIASNHEDEKQQEHLEARSADKRPAQGALGFRPYTRSSSQNFDLLFRAVDRWRCRV